MNEFIKKLVLFAGDLIFAPFNVLFFLVWRIFRHFGLQYFPLHRALIQRLGILPVHDHYYQPRFRYDKDFDAEQERAMPFKLDVDEQVKRLSSLRYYEELKTLDGQNDTGYQFNNGAYEEGDAELYYLMIRNGRPSRILEIGSGHSTRVAQWAATKNAEEGNSTRITCIEPYENPWLEHISGIEVIRKKVEDTPLEIFESLESGDILFIDSSHMIRPGNDVLHIYLNILPRVKPGVIIHVHDIFTPRHYPDSWTQGEYRLWNEQYLLESILGEQRYEILYTLNHLTKVVFDSMLQMGFQLKKHSNPSAVWLVRKL